MASAIDNDPNDTSGQQRLKIVQENWRQKLRTIKHTKNLKSLLFSYSTSVNDGLMITELPAPPRLSTSIQYIRESQILIIRNIYTFH